MTWWDREFADLSCHCQSVNSVKVPAIGGNKVMMYGIIICAKVQPLCNNNIKIIQWMMYTQKYTEYHVQRLLNFHVKPVMVITNFIFCILIDYQKLRIMTLIILNYIKHWILKGNLFKFNIFSYFLFLTHYNADYYVSVNRLQRCLFV